jgi:hypothetical protein
MFVHGSLLKSMLVLASFCCINEKKTWQMRLFHLEALTLHDSNHSHN